MNKIIILLLICASVILGADINTTSNSNCDEKCNLGTYRSTKHATVNCSWACVQCPAKTMSNVTDASQCMNCTEGYVSDPQRTLCSKYQTKIYDLSRPMGIIYLILLVVVLCFILAALIIFAKNRNHELMVLSGFEGLCVFLFGCLIIVIAPIPLLLEPVQIACSVYVGMFNIGVTLVFGVLISRSSFIGSFYNENNEVVRCGLGSAPRVIVIAVTLLFQLVIMIVGFTVSPLQTLVVETSEWNYGYWECSIWASYVFWFGFFYNVLLSCVGNFLSCSSTKMDEICEELKYVIMSYLVFYLLALVEVILFFRIRNEALAEGQAIMCVLFAMGFLGCYVVPKVHVVLYRTQEDGVTIKGKLHVTDNEAAATSLIHAKDGYKHRVLQMKIRDVEA